ncbi:hypothetical protein C8R47DRAFT_1083044 [Mycena vitilis]|nr:hypothetical protein C8R47DRAFT_1083044 [Mycena vitilis]
MLPQAFEFLNSLPAPPKFNVAEIKGNLSDDEKLLNAKGFWHLLSTAEFAKDIGKRLRIASINFDDETRQCELVLEIEVAKDMGNFLGVLHGACITFMADICCAGSIIMLGAKTGVDARVLTRSMELTFARPAFIGDTLEIVATSNDLQLARCDIRNKKSGKICATAVQSLAKAGKSKL